MKTMYKVKNISRCLTLLGLYPGESKNIDQLDDTIRDLFNKQLISLTEIAKSETVVTESKKKNQVKVDNNLKDCEVKDTNGGN